jgi:phage terminase large subunit
MAELALYEPNDLQRRLHAIADQHRFSVCVCPRQHGKSTFVRVEAVHRAATLGHRVAIIAPLRTQVKGIHWDALVALAGLIPGSVANVTELKVTVPGGGFVQLFGSDLPDSLRGMAWDDVFFDEAAYIAESVFSLIIRAAVSATQGRVVFVSTPHGRNWFYNLFQQATAEGWGRLHVRCTDLAVLPAGELASIRAALNDEEWAQEMLCKWDAVQVGAIFVKELAVMEAERRIGLYPHDPAWPVVTAMDIGVRDATALVWAQPIQGALRLIDYEEHSGLGLPDYVRLIVEKGRAQGFTYAQHIAPFDLGTVEFGSGISRLETARSLGMEFDLAPKLSLAEGLDALRRAFPRFYIHRGPCERLLESLSAYHRVWRQDLKMFSDAPQHDWSSHGVDCLRYLVVGLTELGNPFERRPPVQLSFDPYTGKPTAQAPAGGPWDAAIRRSMGRG